MSSVGGMDNLQEGQSDIPVPMETTPTPLVQPKLETASPQPQQQHQEQQDHESLQQQEEPQQHQSQSEERPVQEESQRSPEEPHTSSDDAQTYLRESNIFDAISDFDSSIPDQVVQHFLNVAGMQTTDQRIVRLIAIAAQKFIHDIVSDSLQHCKLRGAQGKKTKDKKFTLVMEDLAAALAEYGIEVKRQLYFN